MEQGHHTQYEPVEIKEPTCVKCHVKGHGHGTGAARGTKRGSPSKGLIFDKRKVLKVGGSRCLALPPDFIRDCDDVLVFRELNGDIRLINPKNTQAVYSNVTDFIRSLPEVTP